MFIHYFLRKISQCFEKYSSEEFHYDVYRCALKVFNFLKDHSGFIAACSLLPGLYRVCLISFIASDSLIFPIFTAIIIVRAGFLLDAVIARKPKQNPTKLIELFYRAEARKKSRLVEKLRAFEVENETVFKEKVEQAFEQKNYRILKDAWKRQRQSLTVLVSKTLKSIEDQYRAISLIPPDFSG